MHRKLEALARKGVKVLNFTLGWWLKHPEIAKTDHELTVPYFEALADAVNLPMIVQKKQLTATAPFP